MNAGLTIRIVAVLFLLLGAMHFCAKSFGGPLLHLPADVLALVGIIGGVRLLRLEESGRQIVSALSLANAVMAGLVVIIGFLAPQFRALEVAGRRYANSILFFGVSFASIAFFFIVFAFLRRTDVKTTCRHT